MLSNLSFFLRERFRESLSKKTLRCNLNSHFWLSKYLRFLHLKRVDTDMYSITGVHFRKTLLSGQQYVRKGFYEIHGAKL